MEMIPELSRCDWAVKPLDVAYHDEEWGVPSRDSRHLFEMLILEGAQAGVSWSIVLARREGYRMAFDGFDPVKMAAYGEAKAAELLQDTGIIRNRAKIRAASQNARAWLALENPVEFLWSFTGGRTLVNEYPSFKEVPAVTPEAEAMSKALKKAGFSFVGPTICYAFMQAVGMVNDHLVTCHRYEPCRQLALD